jgi:hypothetical protein
VARNFDGRLNAVVSASRGERAREAEKAEAIMAAELDSFLRWMDGVFTTFTTSHVARLWIARRIDQGLERVGFELAGDEWGSWTGSARLRLRTHRSLDCVASLDMNFPISCSRIVYSERKARMARASFS